MDGFRGNTSAFDEYIGWVIRVHSHADALIAGDRVRAPLSELPWCGRLAPDESSLYARAREVDYLRLQTSRSGPVTERDEDEALAARPLPTYLTAESHVDRFDAGTLASDPGETLADRDWRAVVLGDPGSGKTTLVRRLVLQAARAARARETPGWRLPILCRASELAAAISADTEGGGADPEADADADAETSVAAFVGAAIQAGWDRQAPAFASAGGATPISPDVLVGLATAMSAQGRLMLVVDGLDEVATRAQRAQLVALIERFIEAQDPVQGLPVDGRGNQILVTSRLVGYYATPFSDSVRQLILLPMDAESALATGSHWLRHYAHATDRNPRGMLEQFQQVLVPEVSGGPDGGMTAGSNPYLLVSLVSAVASGRLKRRKLRTLGIVRSDLYEFMLADALDRAADRFEVVPDRTLLRNLHAAMAYQMHRTASGVLEPKRLREFTERALADLGDPPGSSVESAVEYLRGLGLFTDRGQNLFGFIHLTVEEYLAGCWLVESAAAIDLVVHHIGDPRWVEPIRLALGHLGRSRPADFHKVLMELLRGPVGEHVANLVIADLTEFDAVRPAHIEAVVEALLAADARRMTRDATASGAADSLARLQRSQVTLPGDDQPVDVVRRTLVRILRTGETQVMVAAARVVDILGMVDPQIGEALFVAQERDSSAHGWATVRALQRVYAVVESPTFDASPQSSARVWSKLSADDRTQLAGLKGTVEWQPPQVETRQTALTGALTPFRGALDDSRMRARVLDSPVPIQRVVLCLYGGVAFRDRQRWLKEQERLQAEFGANEASPEVRRAAAIQLDTVVVPAIESAKGDTGFDSRLITVDSPLTPSLLAWITAEETPETFAERLSALVMDRTLDDSARGDAAAAWLALGIPGTSEQAAVDFIGGTEEGVRRRCAWRLDRARFLLGDAVGRLQLSEVVLPFYRKAPDELAPDITRVVIRALCELGRAAPDAGNFDEQLPTHLREYLVAAVCASADDKPYQLAVVVDTTGPRFVKDKREGLPAILATAHTVAASYGRYAQGWDLDPLSPLTGTVLAEALTAVAGLAMELTFLRCWLIDRMLEAVVADGYAVEALCIALRGYRADPDSVVRTLRLYSADSAVPSLARFNADFAAAVSGHDLERQLQRLATHIADPYAQARARVQVAAMGNTPFEVTDLVALARRVHEPGDRLRLIELAVRLRLVDWDRTMLRMAMFCVRALEDRGEQVRAYYRLINDLHSASVEESDDADLGFDLGEAAGFEQHFDGDSLAQPLLDLETFDVAGEPGRIRWALLTAAALASDALADPRIGGRQVFVDEAVHWTGLEQPETGAEAARSLYINGQIQGVQLDARRCGVIDSVLQSGRADLVEPLLTVGALTRSLGVVEKWRHGPHRRVADLSALLLLELGSLDSVAVQALPRLLTDPSDRVRMRTGVATSVVSRGAGGVPHFQASALGPRVVADLAAMTVWVSDNLPAASGDLHWALTDVVHDSPQTLLEARERLSGDPKARRRLLTSVVRVTMDTFLALPDMLPQLDEVEQCALLAAIHDIAANPYRSGVNPEAVSQVGEMLLAGSAALRPAAREQVLSILGRALPLSMPLADLVDAFAKPLSLGAEDATGRASPASAAYGLGFIFERANLPSADRIRIAASSDNGNDDDSGLMAVLRRLFVAAGSPHEEVAAAAAGALLRGGNRAGLAQLLALGVDVLAALWGLFGELDLAEIGPVYYSAVRRICEFIREPPGPALDDAAAAARTARLTELLLERLDAALDLDDHAVRSSSRPWRQHLLPFHLITVAAELAKSQPAAVRSVVDVSHPLLRAKLVASLRSASWLTRLHGARLLIFLGIGDRETVSAVLDIAHDTDHVRQMVLRDVRWFDRIQPDGLAVLNEAVEGPSPARGRFAVLILAALLENRKLTDADRPVALQSIRRGLDRPDSEEQVLVEYNGEVLPTGTYAEAGRKVQARLMTGEMRGAAHAETQRIVIELPDSQSAPADYTVTVGLDGKASLLNIQARYYNEVEDRPVPDAQRLAFERLVAAARDERVAFSAALDAAPRDA